MKRKTMLLLFAFGVGLIYLINDYRLSFDTVEEAISSKEHSTDFLEIDQMIGGTEYGNNALYFFLNKDDHIVGVSLDRGIFGWRYRGASSGSGLDITIGSTLSRNTTTTTSHTSYFGLTSYEEVDEIIVNGSHPANLIHLEDHLDDVEDLQNSYLWYGIINEQSEDLTIEVFDKERELIHSS